MGRLENGHDSAFIAAGSNMDTELSAALRGMLADYGLPILDPKTCTKRLTVTVEYKRDSHGHYEPRPHTRVRGGSASNGQAAEIIAFHAVCGYQGCPGLEHRVRRHRLKEEGILLAAKRLQRGVFTFGHTQAGNLALIGFQVFLGEHPGAESTGAAEAA